MESSMQRLINNLKRLSESEEVRNFVTLDEHDTYFLNETLPEFEEKASDELKELVTEIMGDLNEWLISDSGQHHYPNRETLNRFGYRFEKGEEDSFGPVTSIIVLPYRSAGAEGDFRLVYG